jgi:hypothetical protein
MATTAALKRQAERAEALAQYIKSAEIIFSGDMALVTSEFEEGKLYTVRVAGMVASSCDCPDARYRKRHCKHQEAVEARLNASLPLINTPEAKDLIADLAKVFKTKKVRRSAMREDLPVLAEGIKIRKVRGVKALVAKQAAAPVEVVELPKAA